ncbi:MFS family permease [Arthrobacter sp. B3I4]|nr:MFS family permease [Arthrobacter sp. B3I4]
MSQTLPSTTPGTAAPAGTPKKAALASFLGSAVEYYDFFIFGSAAALIFPKVFFPDADTNAAIMSFATFGFAYVARPVGAIILGHFGDRVGRRKVLMFTLLLMGASTFVIGCLPDFKTVGWWAPVLLVIARLCQGLSAAGEQAGASSMTLEHAPDNRRSFFTSWTLTGTQGGQILAALVFIPAPGAAGRDQVRHRLAYPVLAQRRRRGRCLLHPPHAARAAGL